MIPNNITAIELRKLLIAYDRYIQNANEENLYATGWMPVCISEFYDNEFQEEIAS